MTSTHALHRFNEPREKGRSPPHIERLIVASPLEEETTYIGNSSVVKNNDIKVVGEDKKKEDTRPVPPDGGYGWVIVFGCFLTHIFIGGLERGGGIFFMQFLDRYGKSNQLTAWPLALTSSMFLWCGPVASAICSRYSARASLMVGGLLMSVGLILTSFSDNFYILFVYFTLIYGLGLALCYAPSLIIVNMYFNKRMSLAVGLGSSGVGAGTFALVPLMQLLFDTYGFSGAFLILGGLALHMNLVAMLFRPLSLHRRFTKEVISLSAIKKPAKNTHFDKQKPKETHRKSPSCCKGFTEIVFPVDASSSSTVTKTKKFDFSLLKDLPFFIYCVSLCLFTLAFKSSFVFLPALITSKGISEDDAAMVIALSGIFDMLSRILTGMILDHHKLRPFRTVIYNSFMFGVAGAAFILPYLHTFWSFVITTCIFSLFTGACVCQKSVIVVDILGVENMANAFGLLISFQGFGTLIGPPLSGFLKDYLGAYDGAFYLGGTCMVMASFLMILCNILLTLRKAPCNDSAITELSLSPSDFGFG